MDKPVVIGLVGPTAGGKTALSLSLAAHHPIEVVCMDSMQVYRGMDIGTAKPTAAEQARIPHYMLDVADPAQPYSVAEYREGALAAIQGILDRGHMPVLVGGTGLYLRALSQGLTLGNTPRDDEVRGRYEEMLEVEGKQALHDHLRRVDPVSADRLHINDTRRVIRALEVWAVTGEPFSAQRVPEGQEPYRFLLYAPDWPRQVLYQRIDSRVDQMMAQVLMGEVDGLLRRGLTADVQSMQGLGYKELVPCLTGRADIGEAVALIKRRTRNYAKRQLTWFRPDGRIRWLAPEGMEEALPQQVRLDMEEK
ncbi:MAG: tRNA (adenosine(37)-N6)-dimethylallyltransferase MiaA [Chloroflexi bacterium]|nr:tRNA (adenosine(37)-N6)-dimethylallyltransferase MiaA [Chloroflexota bacterium]